jgi:hypothetical protein
MTKNDTWNRSQRIRATFTIAVAFLCTTAAAEPAARHGRQPTGIKSILNVFVGPSSEL